MISDTSHLPNPVDNLKYVYLNLIIGPMFSGKTTTMISEIHEFSSRGMKIIFITHDEGSRSISRISHTGISLPDNVDIFRLSRLSELDILDIAKYDIICIDESQFFEDLVTFVQTMMDMTKIDGQLSSNKYMIIAGLSGDFRMKKFGYILDLIPMSDKITTLTSRCHYCYVLHGDHVEARFSRRIVDDDKQISSGGSDKYRPVCKKHHLIIS